MFSGFGGFGKVIAIHEGQEDGKMKTQIEKEYREHMKTCSICFWCLAIWRCPEGKKYLQDTWQEKINTD